MHTKEPFIYGIRDENVYVNTHTHVHVVQMPNDHKSCNVPSQQTQKKSNHYDLSLGI